MIATTFLAGARHFIALFCRAGVKVGLQPGNRIISKTLNRLWQRRGWCNEPIIGDGFHADARCWGRKPSLRLFVVSEAADARLQIKTLLVAKV
jgi:hypothetical protein